jgi:glycosyltransferase involved in cell wall biosynthesis
MNVLHVISSLDQRSGGPPVALAGLAKTQAELGLNVAILATWVKGSDLSAAARLRERGVQVALVGPALRPLLWHWRLSAATRSAVVSADVVHIHGVWEEAQHRAARVCQALGKPYLIRPCGMLDPWQLKQKALKKRLYLRLRLLQNLNRASALHFTSQPECEGCRPLHLTAPAIIEPNGVDLDECRDLPPKGTFRAKHAEVASRPLVLFLSRLHPKKGLELLIPAFAQAQTGEARLVIAGPDADGYRAKLEDLVRQHGLAERALFTGMLHGRDRLEALADADLFVLPSYQENFGIAVVESLATGTPVLISDQVNIHAEISAAGVGGVVPTQVEPLARELTHWLSDHDLRRAAATRARDFVWQRYDWRQIAQRWTAHYGALLGTGKT